MGGTIADLHKPLWNGRNVVAFSGCRDEQTSSDTGQGGIFTYSLLLAIEALQQSGRTNYSCNELFLEVLRQDDGVFKSKQDISCETNSGCHKKNVMWPLIPRDRYVSPPLPGQFRKIGPPTPRSADVRQNTMENTSLNTSLTDSVASYAMPANRSPAYDASFRGNTEFAWTNNRHQDATLLDPSGHAAEIRRLMAENAKLTAAHHAKRRENAWLASHNAKLREDNSRFRSDGRRSSRPPPSFFTVHPQWWPQEGSEPETEFDSPWDGARDGGYDPYREYGCATHSYGYHVAGAKDLFWRRQAFKEESPRQVPKHALRHMRSDRLQSVVYPGAQRRSSSSGHIAARRGYGRTMYESPSDAAFC